MRATTGVCVVAAGLLFSAGAIASADPDTSGSSTSAGPSQGAEATSQGTAASGGQAESAADSETNARPDKTPTMAVGLTGSQREGRTDGDEATVLTGTDGAREGAPEGADGAGDVESLSDETTTAGADVTETEPVSDPVAIVATETAAASSAPTGGSAPAPAAAPTPAPPSANPAAPPVRPVAPIVTAFGSVTTNLINAMATAAQYAPATIAYLPTSPTPVTDVIASVQAMLTSISDAFLPLTQVSGDLYTLLGIPAPTGQPLIGVGGASHSVTAPVAVDAPLLGPLAGQAPPAAAPAPGAAPLFGTMTPQPARGTVATSVAQPLSLSGTVPLAEAASNNARSILEHVLEAVLVPASLTALAAMALPGIGGLLVVCALGMRVGYRQAKAVLAVRVSAIARFAGPGPLGVVRSGSMTVLRQRARGPRTLRAVCPQAAQAALEPVA